MGSIRSAALAAAAACFLATPPDARQGEPAPPNFLILLADDLGVDQVGAYGVGTNPPPTPHLDQLAAGGLLFRNAWSAPVCSPTRAMLQTGRFGFRTGIGIGIRYAAEPAAHALEAAEVTLPELLDLGTGGLYAHAAIGKWHLSTAPGGGLLAPNAAGYQHFAGTLSNFEKPYSYYEWPRVVNGTESVVQGYATSVQVDDALEWIGGVQEPWLCYLAFNAPHLPHHAPPAQLHAVDLSQAAPDPLDDPVPYARAMVSALDTEIGRLLAGIPPDVLDRTLILFLGDNGSLPAVIEPPFDPQHGKGTVYEGGVNVPFLVKGPPVQVPGSECTALVNVADVFATVAELAGIDPAAVLPGVTLDSFSLVPYLADPAAPPVRAYNYAEFFHPNDPARVLLPLPCQQSPAPSFCQHDAGFGGPGNMLLSACGDPLFPGNTAQLSLTGAPPGSTVALFVSDQYEPTPFLGGTLVTGAASLTVVVVPTDAQGSYSATLNGYYGVGWLYAQAVGLDLAGEPSFVLSNAVRGEYLSDHRTIRDARYKLIVDAYSCQEQLYDLELDPFEQYDLLLQPVLTQTQQTSYDLLQLQMGQLLSSP